jgi:hypothetical protein
MKIDDFLFEPCGYSMNGIAKEVSISCNYSVDLKLFLFLLVLRLITVNLFLSALLLRSSTSIERHSFIYSTLDSSDIFSLYLIIFAELAS